MALLRRPFPARRRHIIRIIRKRRRPFPPPRRRPFPPPRRYRLKRLKRLKRQNSRGAGPKVGAGHILAGRRYAVRRKHI